MEVETPTALILGRTRGCLCKGCDSPSGKPPGRPVRDSGVGRSDIISREPNGKVRYLGFRLV